MGLGFCNFFDNLFRKRPIKALVLGLDSAGKTAIIYKTKLRVFQETIPTLGINV
jgi:GTPase SAR1 family protein